MVSCVKFPAGKWKTVLVHRLMYMLHHNLSKIPRHLSCSHICNVSLCVNPQHMILEPLHVNNNRRQCVREQHCFGHVITLSVFRNCAVEQVRDKSKN